MLRKSWRHYVPYVKNTKLNSKKDRIVAIVSCEMNYNA